MPSHFLETAAEPATITSNHSKDDAAADGNNKASDDTDEENEDIMPPKKISKSSKTPKTTAGAKSDAPVDVDAITSGIQCITMTKGVKNPASTSYSTKVEDPILICTVFIDEEQFVEFDVNLADVLMCGDGIKALLAPDGMGVPLQKGVYASFFTNRRFWKDLGATYNKDSRRITDHHKVCDKFKEWESTQNGIMYGECQSGQLPCECTGLVELTYIGKVPAPITIPVTVPTDESGMKVEDTQHHIQFIVNTTFRVKTVEQVEKEKKAATEVTHHGWDICGDYQSKTALPY